MDARGLKVMLETLEVMINGCKRAEDSFTGVKTS